VLPLTLHCLVFQVRHCSEGPDGARQGRRGGQAPHVALQRLAEHDVRPPTTRTQSVSLCSTNSKLTLQLCVSALRIIPPQLSLYMSLAPEAKLTYPLAGPAGQATFNAGMQGFEAQQFRGLGVFTSTPVRNNAIPTLPVLCQCRTLMPSSHTLDLFLPRSTRFRTTRTACRCCSARPRSASSTACRPRPSGTTQSVSRRRTWTSCKLSSLTISYLIQPLVAPCCNLTCTVPSCPQDLRRGVRPPRPHPVRAGTLGHLLRSCGRPCR